MCFSATASFAIGAPLIPAGMFCLWSAALKKPGYLGLAAVPLVVGLQQISEGFVWHAIEHGDTAQMHLWSLVFLFFALAFWPTWFPILATMMEPEPIRRSIFAAMSVICLVWFWILYFPLVTGAVAFEARVTHHSIDYAVDALPVHSYVPKGVLRVLYFLSVALPMVLGSANFGRIPGLVLGASALVTALLFEYAFISVWCFFAAVLSAYLCVIFYQLPRESVVPDVGAEPPSV